MAPGRKGVHCETVDCPAILCFDHPSPHLCIGTVVPVAMVLRYHPTHGLQSAGAALAWGVVLVMVYARTSWGGRPEASAAGPDAAAAASAPQA